jgi:hypothetical protein
MSDLLYAERDIEALDDKGNFYCKHVSAMTREGLHSKVSIAAELGYRDATILDLQNEITRLRAYVQRGRDLLHPLAGNEEIDGYRERVDGLLKETLGT